MIRVQKLLIQYKKSSLWKYDDLRQHHESLKIQSEISIATRIQNDATLTDITSASYLRLSDDVKKIFESILEQLATNQKIKLDDINIRFAQSYRNMILIIFVKFSTISNGLNDLEKISFEFDALLKPAMQKATKNNQNYFDPIRAVTVITKSAEEKMVKISLKSTISLKTKILYNDKFQESWVWKIKMNNRS